ncbi:MAG: hypothetical protein H0U49_12200 [Parachlamydiaceae bacterium]|nr:hypothetical protein [Parachlamydiaceae bacterium]
MPLLFGDYITPLITGITALIKFKNRLDGTPLPKTELQEIRETLNALPNMMIQGIAPTLEAVVGRLTDLDGQIRDYRNEIGQLTGDINTHFSKINTALLELKMTHLKSRVNDYARVITNEQREVEKAKDCNKLKKLNEMYSNNIWNGIYDIDNMSINGAALQPQSYVGVIASKLDNSRQQGVFIAPELLLCMIKKFLEMSSEVKSSDEANELKNRLISQCGALKWLYGQCESQAQKTVEAFEAFTFRKNHVERLEKGLESRALKPVKKIDVEKVIQNLKQANKFGGLFIKHIFEEFEKIRRIPNRHKEHFDLKIGNCDMSLVSDVSFIGIGTVAMLSAFLGPALPLGAALYSLAGLGSIATVAGFGDAAAKDSYRRNGMTLDEAQLVINKINQVFMTGLQKWPAQLEPSSVRAVDITWIATEKRIEVKKISSLTGMNKGIEPLNMPLDGKIIIEEELPLVGKILQVQKGNNFFPTLKVIISVDWAQGHTAVHFDPTSHIQKEDIEALYKSERIPKQKKKNLCSRQFGVR